MSTPVTSATHVQDSAPVSVSPSRQPAPPVKSQPPATQPQPRVADTVQISAAARALQETTESAAQTTREASAGDVQAQRLLAKQAAAHAAEK